jgi:hypothetical protein
MLSIFFFEKKRVADETRPTNDIISTLPKRSIFNSVIQAVQACAGQ